jgi:membrane protein
MRERLLRLVGQRRVGAAAIGAAAGYTRHATAQLAAAISYRVLFSLVPLLALIVSAIDLFLPDDLRARLATWLTTVIPRDTHIDESVEKAVTEARLTAAVASLIALGGLLWAASGMMASVRVAFRVIWEEDVNRPYVRAKLMDFALVMATGIVVVVAFGLSLVVSVLAEIGRGLSDAFGRGSDGRALGTVAQVTGSIALTIAVLFLLYRTVPPVRPPFAALWPAALLGGVAIQVAGGAYGFYLAHWGTSGTIYGPLGAILGFLAVLYVGVIVLLIGAELVAAWPPAAAGAAAPANR